MKVDYLVGMAIGIVLFYLPMIYFVPSLRNGIGAAAFIVGWCLGEGIRVTWRRFQNRRSH